MNGELFPNGLAKRLGALSILSRSGRLGIIKGHIVQGRPALPLISLISGNTIRVMICVISTGMSMHERRTFIKQFLDEQEMRIHILLDPTKSMGADGKWNYARQLSIALGQLALKSGDTLSFSSWTDGQDYFFRKKGAAHRASVTKFISAIDVPGSTENFTDRALASIPKAVTVLFILTDGLEEVGKWEHLFRRLPGICGDVRVVTIHSKVEEVPDYEGDIRFVDIESGDGIEVTITRRAIQDYLEKKSVHEAQMIALARKFGIQLIRAEVTEGVMETVTKKMRHAGWVR